MSGLIQQKSTSTTRLKHTKKRAFLGSFQMEEEVGFEPTERVNVRQFSRLLQSTALALLQRTYRIPFILLEQNYLSSNYLRVILYAPAKSITKITPEIVFKFRSSLFGSLLPFK